MKKALVINGSVFISRYTAEYDVAKGNDAYVVNRNSRAQPTGRTLIYADRHNSGEILYPITSIRTNRRKGPAVLV